ncbi:MAG: hypothetical protein JWP02_197, partial [Acidimicrobiales bacterium]|nr:hypothetical protein [Acidimicrobiales bacterium]
MRRFGAIVVVVVVASVMAGCTSRALGPGEARLTVSSGRAQVAAAGKGWQPAHSDQRLHREDRVRVVQGLAQVAFAGQRALELRGGSEVRILPQPELVAGDVLATAKDAGLTVAAGNADASVRRGAAHVVRGLGATAAAYSGEVTVSSAGRQLGIPALRQAAVPAPGFVPPNAAPLDYRADNPWDRRFLGDAIELGDELQARSQGFTFQLAPDEGHTAGFYRQLVPALDKEQSFGQALVSPDLPAGETLVGAAISVQGHEGDFVGRWRSVFEFRGQGARWGLVALDQHVTRGPLLSEVDDALGRRSVGTSLAAAPTTPGAGAGVGGLVPSTVGGPPSGPAGNAPNGGPPVPPPATPTPTT